MTLANDDLRIKMKKVQEGGTDPAKTASVVTGGVLVRPPPPPQPPPPPPVRRQHSTGLML
jgi:hypothetical protein